MNSGTTPKQAFLWNGTFFLMPRIVIIHQLYKSVTFTWMNDPVKPNTGQGILPGQKGDYSLGFTPRFALGRRRVDPEDQKASPLEGRFQISKNNKTIDLTKFILSHPSRLISDSKVLPPDSLYFPTDKTTGSAGDNNNQWC
ncbi:hypothetical protein [Methylomagnum sp.]